MQDEERNLLLKRLKHRSRQRGFAEADEIFIGFAATQLDGLSDELLVDYEALLVVPDWDSFGWIVGQTEPPAQFAEIVGLMRQTLEKPLRA